MKKENYYQKTIFGQLFKNYIDCSHSESKIPKNEIHIWTVDLDNLKAPDNEVIQMLPDSERKISDRFHFETHKIRYIKCHFILRVLLGWYLRADFYDQEFDCNQYGKPSIKKIKEIYPVYFNLSNSENICVYAFTQNSNIGVDVEKIQNLPDMGNIVKHIFSSVENKNFFSLPERERKKYFFQQWTRKEALLKAVGTGLSFPSNKVDVFSNQKETSNATINISALNKETDWTIWDLNSYEGFAAAIAIEGRHINFAARLRYYQLPDQTLIDSKISTKSII